MAADHGQVTDADLAAMLRRCALALRRAGRVPLAELALDLLRRRGQVGEVLRQARPPAPGPAADDRRPLTDEDLDAAR